MQAMDMLDAPGYVTVSIQFVMRSIALAPAVTARRPFRARWARALTMFR